MYLLNTKELADQIREGRVSEREKKNYYIVISVIGSLSAFSLIESDITNPMVILVMIVLSILITIFGINITFNTNQGNEGSDYVARITMLSLPVSIKVVILVGVIGGCAGFAGGAGGYADIRLDQWPMVLVSAVTELIVFWRINVHLRHINT